MKAPSPAARRQLYILAALASVLILAVVKWGGKGSGGSSGDAPSRPPGPASVASIEDDRSAAAKGRPRPRAGEKKAMAPDEVPFVSVEDLNPPRARRAGETGRNIFDFRVPTVPPPPTPTAAPPPPPGPGSVAFVGPMPPPPPTPTPVPPEITFKFIGTFGPRDRPIAVLLLGDQLLNAHVGDVVFDRYILRNIGYESVDVGFVGYPPGTTKRLGITP
jgi:hypothetical protein